MIYIYGEPKTIYLPSGPEVGYIKLLYSEVSFENDMDSGKVVKRDLTGGTDTLMIGQITAVRHGNGQDWWLVMPRFRGNVFYKYLLTPDGIAKAGEQEIATTSVGLGQACFSPDGRWYARFNYHGIVPDSAFSTFDLYRFDRCSGLLSDRVTKTYSFSGKDGKPGGVAFSGSSRYLYVSRWDTIYQYDLHAPDMLASEVAVAGYDGFLGDFDRPTRFYSLQLAPDNKIYCCVANTNSRYLHVIEQPDAPGLACDVRQHSIQLPVFNNFLLPNLPYYRLWAWEDSPCDTLGSVAVPEQPGQIPAVELWPNPARDFLQVRLPEPARPGCLLDMFDPAGRLVYSVAIPEGQTERQVCVSALPPGCYLAVVSTAGKITGREKICILR